MNNNQEKQEIKVTLFMESGGAEVRFSAKSKQLCSDKCMENELHLNVRSVQHRDLHSVTVTFVMMSDGRACER